MLLYNCFRISLLRKTIELESEERVTGLPIKFSLGIISGEWLDVPRWNFVKQPYPYIHFVWSYFKSYRYASKWAIYYEIVSKAYWIILCVTLLNTLHFMQMRVPTTDDAFEKIKQPVSIIRDFVPQRISAPHVSGPLN